MPLYSYQCDDCGKVSDDYRTISNRLNNPICVCGGTTRFVLSTSERRGPSYPFLDTNMDHQPVEIHSLSHYRKELKKRNLSERSGGKMQKWV